MASDRDGIKERFLAVLKGLSVEERKLFSEVLRIEAAHLNEKAPSLRDDLLKLVRQVVP